MVEKVLQGKGLISMSNNDVPRNSRCGSDMPFFENISQEFAAISQQHVKKTCYQWWIYMRPIFTWDFAVVTNVDVKKLYAPVSQIVKHVLNE